MFNEMEHSPTDDQMDILDPSEPQEKVDSFEPGDAAHIGSEKTGTLTVVKIGGSTLGSHDTTLTDLVELQARGDRFVVVHGGGKTISEWMEKQGVRPKFVNGLRVTDSQSLDIVVAVLTGLINKSLVAAINNIGGKAIGISGADGKIVNAEIADPQLGYVGRVTSINTEPVEAILEAGYMPVIAPVGVYSSSNDENMLLNINADTVAGYISSSIHSDRMVFLTDVEGVLDSSKRLISRMPRKQADSLAASHVIDGGMIPKMEACIEALSGGAISQIIDGRLPGALKEVVLGQNLGTRIG